MSRMVPEPKTRLCGSPEYFHAAYVSTSTGLEAISRSPSKPLAMTESTMDFIIFMFLSTSCRRVSPGFCAAPAQMTTSAASSQSAYVPWVTLVRDEAHTTPWFKSMTLPIVFFSSMSMIAKWSTVPWLTSEYAYATPTSPAPISTTLFPVDSFIALGSFSTDSENVATSHRLRFVRKTGAG